jgi:hypothetical protein
MKREMTVVEIPDFLRKADMVFSRARFARAC